MFPFVSSEPLLARLLLQRRAIPPKVFVPILLFLGVIDLYVICEIAFDPYMWQNDGLIFTMLIVTCLFMVISPILTALLGAIWLTRDIRTDSYELLHLTLLPDQKIARTYRVIVLYRMRIVLFLVVMLSPIFIFGLYHVFAFNQVILYLTGKTWLGPFLYNQRVLPILIMAAFILAVTASLWGMHIFAATLSVCFSFRLRNTLSAGIVSAVLTPVISGLAILLTLIIVSVVLTPLKTYSSTGLDVPRYVNWIYYSLLLLECGLIALIPYLLAMVGLRLAQRWVRKTAS